MPYPLPLTRTEAYLAYKAGVIQQSDLKPSLAVPRNGIDAWLAYWTGLAADYPKREDGTPHILQEEEAYIAYLCGVVNEYPEKCLRRVGAYLRYLISARWGRPDHPLNREELYLSLIKTQVVPSGDPSSDIVIDGTAKAPFQDVKMYGDTAQNSYTGKNLFPSSVTWTVNMAFPTANQGGWANWAGYYGFLDYIEVEPDTTYTFSNAENLRFLYGLQYYDSDKNWISGTNDAKTFTTPSDCHYIRGAVLSSLAPTQCQLEKGSTANSYEPYVGGAPSPSPEYPQPIQTVTGEQTVVVTGKNLFRAKDGQYGDSTLTVDVENGVIHVYGHQHATYDQNIWIPVEDIRADGTYTLTMNYSGFGGGAFRLTKDKSYQAANNFGGTYYAPNRGTPVTASATDITYNWILIYLGHGNTQNEVDYYINPQFESGSSSTDFTPYSHQTLPLNLGTIELCKLVTYQDYIWKDGEDWKIHREVGKSNLKTDCTDWQVLNTDLTAEKRYGVLVKQTDIPSTDPATATKPLFANTLGMVSRLDTYNRVQGISTSPYNQRLEQSFCMYIQSISDSSTATVDAIKSWLKNNETVVYYQSTSPTDTTITNTNLIAQLEALVSGGAENGTTYIKVNATDPNLPGLLVVEAPKYE